MIYILDNDPTKCSQMLDDKSLETMIKDIAQVLQNALYYTTKGTYITKDVKVSGRSTIIKWAWWAIECRANYLYLVELGLELVCEYEERSEKVINHDSVFISHKLSDVMWWASDNVPDLPTHEVKYLQHVTTRIREHTQFPLVMPKKYQLQGRQHTASNTIAIVSYRDYYKVKLKQLENKCTCFQLPCEMSYCICVKWTRREVPDFIKEIL